MKHSQVWFRRSLFYNTILGEFSHENPANWLMRCWWVVGCEQDSSLSQFGGGKWYPTPLAMEWLMFFLGLTKRWEYWRGCRSPDFPKNFQPLGVLLPSHWYVPSLPKSDTSWVRDQLQGGSRLGSPLAAFGLGSSCLSMTRIRDEYEFSNGISLGASGLGGLSIWCWSVWWFQCGFRIGLEILVQLAGWCRVIPCGFTEKWLVLVWVPS